MVDRRALQQGNTERWRSAHVIQELTIGSNGNTQADYHHVCKGSATVLLGAKHAPHNKHSNRHQRLQSNRLRENHSKSYSELLSCAVQVTQKLQV